MKLEKFLKVAALAMVLMAFNNYAYARYIEPDPIGLEGGMNRYGYAEQSPMNRVDPNGLQPGVGAIPGSPLGPPFFVQPNNPLSPAQMNQMRDDIGRLLNPFPLIEYIRDVPTDINTYFGKSQEKGRNWATEKAKREAQTRLGKSPCDILDEMLESEKCGGDTSKIKAIEQAQKYLGCRNIRKRGSR
jgi:hypothetical protein